ncbi:LAGLIDADG family homing endonuclease [Haloarchaeobius iranensis]|uniref:DNA helicase n=1 Tax=Haloarchaeobius iranensis TaxID=996166 RepID=A0A1G9SK63_9EURY|nr:LAGLIDADG family homing endonuclease [Haloarchaeobius iranensis]SDM35195.1 replicative DNA helicase Mcm [Haloarchaeobius iranensis]
MDAGDNAELVDAFLEFYRNYYRDEIGRLAQEYPSERKSLYVDWDDLFTFDRDLADDYRNQPEQLQEYAEEALRLYDLPVDVSLGQAHVRIEPLPDATEIRAIRSRHVNTLVTVRGIVRKATDVKSKMQVAAFECQRCGTLTRIPQSTGTFQEPHECQGCERQGPFVLNHDQSEFVDAQKIRVQESPEGLRGGETPQAIDIHIEDDITGEVTPGDHVAATGILRLEQQGNQQEKSPLFDHYLEGVSVRIDEEQFEDMEISEADKEEIVALSNEPDIYEQMVGSIAPSIFGYDQEKLAMILQLFSGVTKFLPDESRIRGDLHMLLIGDPGTGKCVKGDTKVTLADGTEVEIRELVESNLDDPNEIDDGWWDEVNIELPSLQPGGTIATEQATKVWKREAPETMYRIQTDTGTEIEVTPSHPLFVPAGTGFRAVESRKLAEGDSVAASASADDRTTENPPTSRELLADGGAKSVGTGQRCCDDLQWERIESIESVTPDYDWVYDLEVAGTHNYLSNKLVSHNSQMLSYIRHIAPRSVYTSGKGSSSAGLTAAAVRDDFGDGQQWTLEAGALVLADQGIAAVDELDKMRCVTGDTLVHLGDGRVSRVRDLAHEAASDGSVERLDNGRTIRDVDLEAWTMASNGGLVRRPVTAIHEYDAPDTLYRVRLQSGEQVTGTADHPFFVLEDGERVERGAAELSPGDWTYVPREIPAGVTDGGVTVPSPADEAPVKESIPPAMGAVLGYLAGDGNLYYDQSEGTYGVRFINAEEELRSDFETACEQAFDAETVRPPSERRSDGVETVRLAGKAHADAVIDAGMNLETYDGKRLPEAVTEASRETKAAFVRALADSEGSVGERRVQIHSASYELLMGTKHLLMEFGISTQIQRTTHESKRDVYALTITDADSLERYHRRVGFTLERKESALADAVETVTGDRTILDVVPECGHLLNTARSSLRLYQSECGLDDATYCNFENGDANISIRAARIVLRAFETRRSQAMDDLDELSDADWETLDSLKQTYHVSQSELAERTEYTQQQIAREWGRSDEVRSVVRSRLERIVRSVSETDLSRLRSLVQGDVKWRRVESVEPVPAERTDDRVEILRSKLANTLNCAREESVATAEALLARQPAEADDWGTLRTELAHHGVSFRTLADDLAVDGSTVSRWFGRVVETDQFDEVRDVALSRIDSVRDEVRATLSEVRDRQGAKVYDLTVEGTHNYVANGMVVHNSEDRSAMHQALEQQEISVSKAGINATLKSRCSLLGAANPKYGRFDQYEPISEQIDLEPALISRFDLIFTVTDKPDEEHDRDLAQHILTTNYAGELNTQKTELTNVDVDQSEIDEMTETVDPVIDPELMRKYIAYSKQSCYPRMTQEARDAIEQFYVDLRSKGMEEDAPVPVTARQLEALVRLAEASARVRLSDTVEESDADRAITIVRDCLKDIGVDPETGEFDADVVETGTSKTQRDRIKNLKQLIGDIEEDYDEGAPVDVVLDRADEIGMDTSKAEHEIEKLKQKGEVYEPRTDHIRTT